MASAAEIKELSIEVAKLYGFGLNTFQISKKLDVSYERVLTARKHTADLTAKEAGTLWVTFLQQYQRQYLEVQELKQRAKDKNNLSSEIGAHKLQLELTKEMISFAQRLGLVHEEPTRVDISLEERAAGWERFFGFKGIKQEHLVNSN